MSLGALSPGVPRLASIAFCAREWTMRLTVVGAACLVVLASAARAQAPADVPRDHWAYAAVEDLATKGLIKGYPPEGDFFGKRTVTRYEMATIIERVLQRTDELLAAKTDKGASAAPSVSPAQLDELRRLV